MGDGLFAVSAAIDALIVCGVVAWAVRFRPGWRRIAAAAVLALGALLLKGIAMVAAGLDRPFGVAHVLWLDLVVVVPLAALLLGLLTWRSGGLLVRLAVVLGLLLAPVGAYASFVEPNRLVVERADVPVDAARAGERPIRVGVLSDIQFEHVGEHERNAVRRLMAERPDVILLPGDYHQGSRASFERELPRMRALFARLRAPGGVFAVQGDQESVADARRIFAGTGVRLLVNETARTRVGDRRLTIGGNEKHDRGRAARGLSDALERRPGERDVRILLTHHPDPILRLAPDTRIDLVVAGHTHGGQFQLPLIGPLRTASRVGRTIGAGGLHELDGRRIYVSRGVGVERGQAPKLRFRAPPEISILDVG
ncbi:metallophosphoesterase [Conexibacter woesei DSM 14684]|uniref:Metallophosphoesterase n=2 Tax=Conexibacter TaxID=191494 RepID=D3F3J8_CONWI|nr:metallophosphoesterase [Conexibacter woesei DSM 14684]